MSKKNSTPLEEINHLSQHYEEKVRPCIDLVDSLRSLGVEQDLALPAIAVIGDQSSGKSSVLEALSGVALPRGTGIVTRCPLVLKLKRVKNGTQWYGMLSYQNHIKVELKNPAEVEDAVTKAQNALAGEGKDISHEMINLEIHSTSVPDLTLIDLPGIARVATGNQSQDIEEQIKRLIETFIKKQETINLVVVPANVDIATTEALKMAKTVDPHGQRTLGILTKPDLVDKGAEEIVVNTLNNLVIPLKKGYMVVKCRGQKDINDKMSLTKALDREKKFFENHTHLRACLDEGKATIPHLSERLTNELVSHIKRSLPQLEKQIKEKLEKASTDLRRLGDGVPQDETERANFLIEKINSFNQVLTDMVRAEEYVGDSQTRVFTNIRILFSKWKTELDNKAIQLEEYLRDEVEDSNTHRGKELPGFVNYRTFETIVRRHVEDLEEPAMNLLRATTETITTAVNQTTSTFFEAYPSLMRAAKDPLEDLREQEFERAEERLKSQFKMERIVYSQDGLYSRQLEAVKARPESTKPFVFVKPISADIREMAQHLSAYYMITSDRLANQVPLIVMYHMLEQYIVNVKAAMSGMIRHKDADSFVQEKGDIARKRKYLSERIERLKKARQVLAKSVPDI
ncbi:interferon-induced GTP-binding protein Mx-like isoform X1 [Alosa sapidissima]|uniref:interferon-induced GTP-binding protein Mx-like isoform X1 n=1 Tax=Alosa sapidissima TaxID=34773 RepID=UPI001C08CA40|nr:interferon-induced GTP-binding protein Mx-like isoform X1 [Alosa sapidissima]XP_041929633.1 interferon-induced GTP-binding protein Mx-like isoform X1 [Alosa sapidissima]XP_041929643.1 interferon-induced GTP-binding protein Mx-like isoform X1 [Alosa sapidissima]